MLFTLLIISTICNGQDYYIYKKSNEKTGKNDNLLSEIKTLENKKDSVSKLIRKVQSQNKSNNLESRLRILNNEKESVKEEIKTRKDGFNRALFNDTTRLQSVQLAFGRGDINGQLYANLINDVFISKNNSYLGEISLGSVISNTTAIDSSNNQKASNINNFFNGGGNVFLKYAYLLPVGATDGNDNFTFLFAPSIRTASNLPKLSENEKLESWNIEMAAEFTASLNGRNNKLGLYLKPKVAAVLGSKKFTESILNNDSRSFAYIQIQGAVKVSNGFLISLAFRPVFSRETSTYFKERQFSTIGIQALID